MGAAGVLYPALTTSIGLQATWEFLNEFMERGPVALQECAERVRASRWGAVPRHSSPLLEVDKIKELEKQYLTEERRPDYERTFGHGSHT